MAILDSKNASTKRFVFSHDITTALNERIVRGLQFLVPPRLLLWVTLYIVFDFNVVVLILLTNFNLYSYGIIAFMRYTLLA